MLARFIFFTVATLTAITSAVLAGLFAAVVGLSVHTPAEVLIAMITGAATGGFSAAITLTSIAVSLFFSNPPSPSTNSPSPPSSSISAIQGTPLAASVVHETHPPVTPAMSRCLKALEETSSIPTLPTCDGCIYCAALLVRKDR